jgi:hypothetical protein
MANRSVLYMSNMIITPFLAGASSAPGWAGRQTCQRLMGTAKTRKGERGGMGRADAVEASGASHPEHKKLGVRQLVLNLLQRTQYARWAPGAA